MVAGGFDASAMVDAVGGWFVVLRVGWFWVSCFGWFRLVLLDGWFCVSLLIVLYGGLVVPEVSAGFAAWISVFWFDDGFGGVWFDFGAGCFGW